MSGVYFALLTSTNKGLTVIIEALCDYRPVVIYGIKFEGKMVYVGATSRGVKARIVGHFNNAVSDRGRLRITCPKLYGFFRANPDRSKYSVAVLDQCSAEHASASEMNFVEKYDTLHNGLNANTGGNWARGDQHYMYGKPAPAKAVAASVAARTGKKLSPEHIEAIRKGNARADRKDCKPVIRGDGQEFYGVAEAARALGVTKGAVNFALKKGTKCQGFEFKYLVSR